MRTDRRARVSRQNRPDQDGTKLNVILALSPLEHADSAAAQAFFPGGSRWQVNVA